MIAYKNINTGQVQVFPAQSSRLDMLNEWEQVEDVEVTASVAQAADRAQAERHAIQAAAAIRLDTATGSALAAVASASAANTGVEAGQAPVLPTMVHIDTPPTQASSLTGLLDKAHPDRKVDATPFEANKQLAEAELRHPPTNGVLTRAKEDQQSGRTQIGDKADAKAAALGQDRSIRPSDEADKPQWVQYAVGKGATQETANGLTKQQLIDQYGSKEQ